MTTQPLTASLTLKYNIQAAGEIELEREREEWTSNRLIEEPYICLMKSPATDYQKKASELMYRIPVWRPNPCFEIKISDLSDQVKKELDSIWRYKRQLHYILKEAVSRIFANVNDRYFLLSVKRLLQVRLVP
jgi:hypothetical protein